MKTLFVFVVLVFQVKAYAQAGLTPGADDPSKADLKALTNNGRLVHVELDQKSMGYYVAGTKEGEINFAKLNSFKTQMQPNTEAYEAPAEESVSRKEVKSNKPAQKVTTKSSRQIEKQMVVHVVPRKAKHRPVPALFQAKKHPKVVSPNPQTKHRESSETAQLYMLLILPFLIALYFVRSKDRKRNILVS